MSVDLGAGLNTLTLDNGANTGTVNNVGTLIGGTGTDTITFGTAAVNASISLGAGNDIADLRHLHQHRHRRQHHLRSSAAAATTPSR